MIKIEGTSLALEYEAAALKTVELLQKIITQAEESQGRKIADELKKS